MVAGGDGVDWRLVVGPRRCEGVGHVGQSVAERSKGWASLSVGKHMPRGVGCVRVGQRVCRVVLCVDSTQPPVWMKTRKSRTRYQSR